MEANTDRLVSDLITDLLNCVNLRQCILSLFINNLKSIFAKLHRFMPRRRGPGRLTRFCA